MNVLEKGNEMARKKKEKNKIGSRHYFNRAIRARCLNLLVCFWTSRLESLRSIRKARASDPFAGISIPCSVLTLHLKSLSRPLSKGAGEGSRVREH